MSDNQSKNLETIFKYFDKWVGEPLTATWRAKKRAEVRQIEAKGKVAAKKIEAQGNVEAKRIEAQGLFEIIESDKEAPQPQSQLIAFEQARQKKHLANIGSITEMTYEELKNVDIPDHEPDDDWVERFFNDAQSISSKDMQAVWAKVLAGKISQKASTSLRTLRVLKDMSSDEAKLFEKLCQYKIGDFIFYDERYKQVLTYEEILHLLSIELIHHEPGLAASLTLSKSHSSLKYENEILFFDLIKKDETILDEKKVDIPAITLTHIGKEPSQLISFYGPQEDYLSQLAKFFNEEQVEVHRAPIIERLEEGKVRLGPLTKIDPAP